MNPKLKKQIKEHLDKDFLINWLIDDDIQNILTGDMNSYLDSILREGFIGYRKQSLKDLRQEYNERKSQ